MADHEGIERAIGHLQGTVDALHKTLHDHVTDETTDFLELRKDVLAGRDDLRKEIQACRDDILVGKTQRKMAMFIIGISSGLASALMTMKATIGKLWP